MPGGVDAGLRRLLKDRLRRFLPRGGIDQNGAGICGQHAESIVVSPARASGINQEKFVIVPQNFRAFIYIDVRRIAFLEYWRNVADFFPRIFWSGNAGTTSLDCPGIF